MSNNKLLLCVCLKNESRYCYFKWKSERLLKVPHGSILMHTFTESVCIQIYISIHSIVLMSVGIKSLPTLNCFNSCSNFQLKTLQLLAGFSKSPILVQLHSITSQSDKNILHGSFQFVATSLKLCSASTDITNSCWLHNNVKSALQHCQSSSTSLGSQMHNFTATRAA